MARRAWVEFTRGHPNAHLVAAVVRPPRSPHHLARLQNLLDDLIASMPPASEYATAIVRRAGVAQIHCGFADETDADRFARLAGARAARQIGNWASRRCFTLDASTELGLRDDPMAPDPDTGQPTTAAAER
jgi:hypothetical protein